MRDDQLPTPAQMLARTQAELDIAFEALNRAYTAFGDAADWLRSDWQPAGSALTDDQAATRTAMWETISTGKRLINEIKNARWR